MSGAPGKKWAVDWDDVLKFAQKAMGTQLDTEADGKTNSPNAEFTSTRSHLFISPEQEGGSDATWGVEVQTYGNSHQCSIRFVRLSSQSTAPNNGEYQQSGPWIRLFFSPVGAAAGIVMPSDPSLDATGRICIDSAT